MKKVLVAFVFILSPLFSEAQINQQSVTHILKTLSSDSMQGRYTFAPEIWDAADFIAGEFFDIGLKPIDGADDYLQKFTINSISLADVHIITDGELLDSDHYFALINAQDVNWDDADEIAVRRITVNDDFRTKFGEFNNADEDMIVFVNPAHEAMFSRLRPYFSRPMRNFPGKDGHNKIFILHAPANSFKIQLDKNIQPKKLANVAGMIEGKRKDEIVLFSGHYDHLGILKPVKGDSIANGANDDASGTTAVIELARYFAQRDQPERTLMFVAFTAEEVGGYGSQYFSRQLNPDHIVAMFNIEMIGKPDEKGPNSAWITGFNRSSFGKILQESTESTSYTFYPDPYPNQHLFYRSDNATLAQLGVPAHSISTTPIDVDKDYHQVTDEVETINLSHLTNTIQAIARAAKDIVSGEKTPTRVDPTTVD